MPALPVVVPFLVAAVTMAASAPQGDQATPPKPDHGTAAGVGRSHEALRSELESFVAAHPGRAALSTIGRSLEGREIWLVTLSGDVSLADERPALLLVAGLDGTRGATTDIALGAMRTLLGSNPEALDATTLYVVPRANPDAAERFRALPSPRGALNARRVDEDRDLRVDEDGPRDLNGDGVITLMRQLDPKPGTASPTLVADDADPRILREPHRNKGEVPRYAVWIEGVDVDGDGFIAEDGTGGVDPDLNFPYCWPEFDPRAGVAPLSEPESLALARFVLEHPRIFAVETIGRQDNVIRVPESRGRDATGRLPLLLDEADVPLWNELASLYRETTGRSPNAPSAVADPAGSFELWAYVHRGLPSIATTAWALPEPAKDPTAPVEPPRPEGDGASTDTTAASSTEAPSSAPPPRRPMRGRGRGAPPPPPSEPPSARGADALPNADSARKWLEYSDAQRGGAGFVPWTPFEHPTLGAVEIGGFVPGFRENPPPEAIADVAAKEAQWLAKLLDLRPKLDLRGPTLRTLAPGLVRIDLAVVNGGRLPLAMTPAKAEGGARPLVLRLTAPIERIRSGHRVQTTRSLDPGEAFEASWIVEERAGEPFEVVAAHPVLGEVSIEVRDGALGEPRRRAGDFAANRQLGAGSDDLLEAPQTTRGSTSAPASSSATLPDPAWNRFYDFEEVTEMLRRFAAARPDLATLESIGESIEGRPIWLLTATNRATGPAESKPAMYVDGSIHANEIQATETVLYSIHYLLDHHGKAPAITELLDRAAFYFVPVVNPDSRAAWFREPATPHSHRTGRHPHDDDGDGLFDEDPPNDLDGDGSIGQMWRRDPFGTHRRNPRDPRILERVPSDPRPDGTREYGDWSLAGQEGIDDDGDGEVNEDPPGEYDMNRDWPSDWQPALIQRGAGPWPLFYPETRAIARFILAHPNIAAGQSFHNAGGMILRGPGAPYRERDYPRTDVSVYDAITRAGEELLPFYRPLVIHSGLYTVHGGFVNWLAEGLGVISFTNELWTDKRMLQDGSNPTPEQRQRWRDRMLFGETFTDWTELDHPQYGRVLVGGGTKFASRIPPGFMLEEECHRNFAFVAFHAEQMPLLRWESIETKPLGEGLWEITVSVANDRLIPTRTARAAEKRIGRPDLLRIEPGPGVEIVAAGIAPSRLDRTFMPQAHEPGQLRVEEGVPGHGRRVMQIIAKGPRGGSIALRYDAEKALDLEGRVELGRDEAGDGATTAPRP